MLDLGAARPDGPCVRPEAGIPAGGLSVKKDFQLPEQPHLVRRGRVHRGDPHGHVLCAPRLHEGPCSPSSSAMSLAVRCFSFAGLIGGRTGRSAMGTVELSFGRIGCLFFAALNVLQLVGWTAIMIYDGALATNTVLGIGKWVWCLVIGLEAHRGVDRRRHQEPRLDQQDRHGGAVHSLDRAVRGGVPRRHARHRAGR